MNKNEEIVTNLHAISNCEINLCGDINIDLLKNDNRTRQYKTFIKRLGFTNVINQVTHIKNQDLGLSLLDHYLTTGPNLYQNTGVIPTNASDHFSFSPSGKSQKLNTGKTK